MVSLEGLLSVEMVYPLVIIAVSLVAAYAVNLVLKAALHAAKKTRTDIDERIIKATTWPIATVVILIGVKLALDLITPLQAYALEISRIFSVIWVLLGGLIFYRVFDIFAEHTGKALFKRTGAPVVNIMKPLVRVVKGLIVISLLFAILAILGIDISPYILGWGLLGFALVLSIQPILAEVFSGFSVIANKTFTVGNSIVLPSGEICEIVDIRTQNTLLYDLINKCHITIANTDLAKQKITLLPASKLKIMIPFKVDYGDVEKATAIALNAAKKAPFLVKEPKPTVHILELGDNAKLELAFWISDCSKKHDVLDVVNAALIKEFRKAKVL